MKTIQFTREESTTYSYTVEVADDWQEGDDAFDGQIKSYSEIDGTNYSLGDIEDFEFVNAQVEV
jgi:hypothetical protein